MRYTKPIFEKEEIELKDVILASNKIVNAGEGTLGNISGDKGVVQTPFENIF